MGKHEKERDGFKSRTGFILACIGSAVGMGNIWRFPYMVSDWGGMTFLIPYILFAILIASTGVIEEMALGRAAKGGPIKAFGVCTEMRTGNKKTGELIGLLPVLGSLALAIGIHCCCRMDFQIHFPCADRTDCRHETRYESNWRHVRQYCFCFW